jgi:hypothetical protein
MHKINELLQLIADNVDKPLKNEPPIDLEAKLRNLERQMEKFKKGCDAYIAQLGITKEDMQAYMEHAGKAAANNSSREALEKTKRLKEQIEKKKTIIEKFSKPDIRASAQDISVSEQKNLANKSPTVRKGLFKRVGGNKNWRPL